MFSMRASLFSVPHLIQNKKSHHRPKPHNLQFSVPVVEDPDAIDDDSKVDENALSACCGDTVRRLRHACSRKTLYKRLPILRWLPRYNGQDALGDLVAGVTVGLTVIPQSLAYSNVAGLPPEVSHCFWLFFYN